MSQTLSGYAGETHAKKGPSMLRWLFASFLSMSFATALAAPLDRMEPPSATWTGPVFRPNFAFPSAAPQPEIRPWEGIDFKTNPADYMASLLAYALEGQDRTSWDIARNPVRQWFHVPWMGPGGNGREFINGFTRERNSRAGELGPAQSACRQNWAVGFYNPAGGFALGQIWKPVADETGPPNLASLPFPVGTVVVKFLYTEAVAAEVPLLSGAPEATANVHSRENEQDLNCPDNTRPRAPASLRLLQVDVAVRDARANETGWVFGTFIYDGRLSGANPWAKLRPVGLMWGNDPQLNDAQAAQGIKPTESIVFSDFGLGRQFGRGGRMNGPVDNPISACISCHMTAQWPNPAPVTPPSNADWAVASCWFRNLGPTAPFGSAPSQTAACGAEGPNPRRSLDFSLQLAVALRNFRQNAAPISPMSTLSERVIAQTINDWAFDADGDVSLPISREGSD